MIRDQIVDEALTWVDTPYHVGACLKGIGVDCAQLIAGIGLACGVLTRAQVCAVPWYDIATASHTRTGILVKELLRCGFTRKETAQIQIGDVLTFNTGMDQGHLGVVVSNDMIVHACWRRAIHRVILQRGSRSSVKRCYAYPGVA